MPTQNALTTGIPGDLVGWRLQYRTYKGERKVLGFYANPTSYRGHWLAYLVDDNLLTQKAVSKAQITQIVDLMGGTWINPSQKYTP